MVFVLTDNERDVFIETELFLVLVVSPVVVAAVVASLERESGRWNNRRK